MDYETEQSIKRLWGKLNGLSHSACCCTKTCLGISPTGNPDLVLNQQGNWIVPTTGGEAWSIDGNAGTDPSVNFLGTTDNKGLFFRVNNANSGFITSGTHGSVSLGQGALSSSLTKRDNSAFGFQALANDTSGSGNTAIGSQSSVTNITGTGNTTIGYLSDIQTDSTSGAIALGSGAIASDNQFAIPDSVTTIKFKGIVYTLPTSLPLISGVLTCDSSGNLSWV